MINTDYLKKIEDAFAKLVNDAESPNALEQMKDLNEKLLENKFTMQGKPFPTFLKPLFVEKRIYKNLQQITNTIMDCVEKVSDLFYSNPEMEKYFEMDPIDLELARIKPNYPRRVINGRLDAFLSEDGLKFLEFNCDSPCGMGWHDKLLTLLSEIPVIDAFFSRHQARYEPILPQFTEMIRIKNSESGGPKEFTVAVATDWDSTVRYDLELVASHMNSQPGITSFFWDPREAEFDGENLYMNGKKIHVVFRDDIRDFTSEMEKSKPVLDAVRKGKICFINPFSSRLGGLKCVLWFMTDEKSQHLFTKNEIKIIRDTIPWTRFMKQMETDHHNRKIDLFPFIRANKDNFVLKPNAGYGGFGVTIGCDVDQKIWDNVLDQIAGGESWVVQELARIPVSDFPEFKPDLVWNPKNVNINFFAFNGKFGGGMVRVSNSKIINVHQGGGLVPICYI
jgi:glutathionylspermidine synthase